MPNPMYGPFSAGTGASFADADWRDLLSAFVADGVAKGVLSGLVVSAGATTTVNAGTGQSLTRGLHFKATTITNLAIAAANVTNPRIDLVVAHANLAGGQTVALQVITGVAAPSPAPPTVTQTEGTAWEIAIAQVLVPANAVSSAAYTITDVRPSGGAFVAAASVTDAMMANQKVNRTGDTMTGPLVATALTASGVLSTDGGTITTTGAGGMNLSASGISLPANGHFAAPQVGLAFGGAMRGRSLFTGSGSGTYSHGLGTTPNHVTPIGNFVGTMTGPAWDSATGTQVHITCGTANAFSAEAMLF